MIIGSQAYGGVLKKVNRVWLSLGDFLHQIKIADSGLWYQRPRVYNDGREVGRTLSANDFDPKRFSNKVPGSATIIMSGLLRQL
jgi:hypothetical protein